MCPQIHFLFISECNAGSPALSSSHPGGNCICIQEPYGYKDTDLVDVHLDLHLTEICGLHFVFTQQIHISLNDCHSVHSFRSWSPTAFIQSRSCLIMFDKLVVAFT